MSGNSFGVIFKVTTWGESHGPAIGVVLDGCPPNIDLAQADIQEALDRRKPAQGPSASSRREDDRVEVLSGIFEGRTTGTPISLIIYNKDADSKAYDTLKDVFRPGHGDITYYKKYGIRDHRGGGRASGRETAARVAAGAVAAKVTARSGMEVIAYTKALGGIAMDAIHEICREAVNAHWLMCPNPSVASTMEKKLEQARLQGDSLGGIVEVVVNGCPAGLGEPIFDKMEADLAKALMSIGTVKGVEIGAGFSIASMTGSEANDPITPDGFASNRAGGILAGITNGDKIIIRVACKPIASIAKIQKTIDVTGNPVEISIGGRHDVSVIPRIVPVCEAMVNLVLADHLLRQKAVRE
jgi:chorismate synthase